ncbi:MAG: IS66 family insertion sequence element accessory protein TnpA, partial [Enterobacteriaceae bacterium]
MVRYSKEEKEQHLAAWQESGLSKTAYCQQVNINIATFYYWLEKKR